jgi:hypothetical protein
MTSKVVLIVSRTATEAAAYASVRKLTNWRFVMHAGDLRGAHPISHTLIITGEWRLRSDLAEIRLRAHSHGLRLPL